MGSQLEVNDGYRVAIVKDNEIFDLFNPGTYILSDKRLPKLSKYLENQDIDKSKFKAIAVYVSRELIEELKWGISFNLNNYSIQSFGKYNIKIVQILYFINQVVNRRNIENDEELIEFFRNAIENILKNYFDKSFKKIKNNNFDSNYVKDNTADKLKKYFKNFGIVLENFKILNVNKSKIKDKTTEEVEDKNKETHSKEENYEVYNKDKLNLGADLKEIFPSGIDSEGDTESFIICNNCKEKIKSNNKFCPYCGTKIQKSKDKIQCNNCNKLVDKDSKYCSNCGNLIGDSGE